MSHRRLLVGVVAVVSLSGLALVAAGTWWAGPRRAEPATTPTGGVLEGLCEASTLVAWEGGYLVGDNEEPGHLFAFSDRMTPAGEIALGAEVEDIEALAPLPSGLLVVGSQGANKKGRPRPHRERVLRLGALPVQPDLSRCAPCTGARGLPPKEGGLSVEGAAWWRGSLWLGVRSPLVGGQALLLRMAGDPAAALEVEEVIAVDLGGFGIRELVPEGDDLLLLAGPAGPEVLPHRLYRLGAPGASPAHLPVTLPPSAEGILRLDDGSYLYVTDGDGKPGRPCETPATWGHAATRPAGVPG